MNIPPMYPHQVRCVEKYKDESVIPIFTSPGTGKTRMALEIAKAKWKAGKIDTVLIIAPNYIDKQWYLEEIPKWCDDIKDELNCVFKAKTSKEKKIVKAQGFSWIEGKLNVLCVNIDKFSHSAQLCEPYEKYVKDHISSALIIIDEATLIKNPKSSRTQRLLYDFNNVFKKGRSVAYSEPLTESRIILTGTPTAESPLDAWALFEFLSPAFFAMGYYQFRNKYCLEYSIQVNNREVKILINEEVWNFCKQNEYFKSYSRYGVSESVWFAIQQQTEYKGPWRNLEDLKKQIATKAYFIDVEDVMKMPEKQYVRRLLDLPEETDAVYHNLERKLIAEYKGKTLEVSKKVVLLTKLQQIASGFYLNKQAAESPVQETGLMDMFLYDEDDPEAQEDVLPGNEIIWFEKNPKVERLLVDIDELNEQVIVICRFTAEADMLYNRLHEELPEKNIMLFTGWKKAGWIGEKEFTATPEDFKDGKYDIMIANIKCVRFGHNFQANCRTIIFYSCTFSLEDREQTERRVYRLGQKASNVRYIDYVMKDTVEMKLYAALKQKKSVSEYMKSKNLEQMLTEQDEVFNEEYTVRDVNGEVVVW